MSFFNDPLRRPPSKEQIERREALKARRRELIFPLLDEGKLSFYPRICRDTGLTEGKLIARYPHLDEGIIFRRTEDGRSVYPLPEMGQLWELESAILQLTDALLEEDRYNFIVKLPNANNPEGDQFSFSHTDTLYLCKLVGGPGASWERDLGDYCSHHSSMLPKRDDSRLIEHNGGKFYTTDMLDELSLLQEI